MTKWGFPPSLSGRDRFLSLKFLQGSAHDLVSVPPGFQVGMIAANDGILLNSHIFAILRRHLKSHPSYLPLLELFLEVCVMCVNGCLGAKAGGY